MSSIRKGAERRKKEHAIFREGIHTHRRRRQQCDGGVVVLDAAVVVVVVVVDDVGGDLREWRTVGREEEERDDGSERGAAECKSGGRVTRGDGGVNTPVISLKCTWVQPRAEARYYRRVTLKREKEGEGGELHRARNRVAHENKYR